MLEYFVGNNFLLSHVLLVRSLVKNHLRLVFEHPASLKAELLSSSGIRTLRCSTFFTRSHTGVCSLTHKDRAPRLRTPAFAKTLSSPACRSLRCTTFSRSVTYCSTLPPLKSRAPRLRQSGFAKALRLASNGFDTDSTE